MIQNRSPFKTKARKYQVENKTATETTVYVYDEIGWFGIQAEQFVKDLNAISTPTIHLRINSPGGSVFDGTSMYNAIKQHKSKVVVHIDGLAASIASIVALAGDEVRIAENAYLMIHEPWSIAIGDAEDLRKEADLLDKVSGTIAKTYMDKSGKDEEEIKALMKAETWLTGQEALENGFADAVESDTEEENSPSNLFDLSIFNNVPDKFKTEKHFPSEREIESVLRDVGCSVKQAKEILAKGYPQKDALRDVEQPVVEAEPEVEVPLRDVEAPTPKARTRKSYTELMAL